MARPSSPTMQCRKYPVRHLLQFELWTSMSRRPPPPPPCSPGFRHPPGSHQDGNESWKKKKKKEISWGWVPEMWERVMKPETFSTQRHVTSLCTKGNLLWTEQRVQRFRGDAISPGRGRGGWWGTGDGTGLLTDSLTFMENNLNKAPVYSKEEADGITHTPTPTQPQCGATWQRCENTHRLVAHIFTWRVQTPRASSGRCEKSHHEYTLIIMNSIFLSLCSG